MICEYQSYAEDHIAKLIYAILFQGIEGHMEEIERAMNFVITEARTLENRLASSAWLVGEAFSAADIVVFPGIKQLLRVLERREAEDLRAAPVAAGREFPGDRRVDQAHRGAARLRENLSAALEGKDSDDLLACGSTRRQKSVNFRAVEFRPFQREFAMSQYPCAFQFPRPSGHGRLWQHRTGSSAAHLASHRAAGGSHHDRDGGGSWVSADAAEYGVKFIVNPLTQENYRQVLEPMLTRGDFLLNLSVDVSSLALVKLAHEKGALYLDTCIEPWPGGYTDPNVPPSMRTNYALREQALALREAIKGGPTAVLTHGANPGLVSHFVKQALLNVAADTSVDAGDPKTREQWAALASQAGREGHSHRRARHASREHAEEAQRVRQHLVGGRLRRRRLPAGRAGLGHAREGIAAARPASRLRPSEPRCICCSRAPPREVRTWTPKAGPFHGFLITHGEAISIPDYLTHREGDRVAYRPTVHYAYHPCDDAVLSVHEFAGRNWRIQKTKRILNQEILPGGIDELGVLLAGHKKNAYWFGSQLSIEEARKLCPHNTATSLQVCVSVLSGMVWAMENPNRGVIEPDEMDFRRNLEICLPYLGPVTGAYSDWTPLFDRGRLFEEALDKSDPWQFKNVLVSVTGSSVSDRRTRSATKEVSLNAISRQLRAWRRRSAAPRRSGAGAAVGGARTTV